VCDKPVFEGKWNKNSEMNHVTRTSPQKNEFITSDTHSCCWGRKLTHHWKEEGEISVFP
jgi:hypothetical protein